MAVRLAILVSHAAAVSQLLCQSVRQSGAQSVGQTDSQLVRQMNRGGKSLEKLWCCVSGRVKQGNLELSTELATVKSLKTVIWSVSPSSVG